MANKKAKSRKRNRRLINIKLNREGRTPNQIVRESKRKLMREERLKQRKRA